MRAILIVRLGALGDLIHTLPVAAALRDRFPEATIDWVVDEQHRELLELVPVVDRRITLESRSRALAPRLARLAGALRTGGYEVALDVQGLLKSALVARLSGASRVVGFAQGHLREPQARHFYTETHDPGAARHVVMKNLGLATALTGEPAEPRFPLTVPASPALDTVRAAGTPFAVVNPGAAWPNKRWVPARFGAVARWLGETHRLRSVVTWGPDDRDLADAVVTEAGGAAELAPATTVGDLAAVVDAARLVVSGDTGPLHLAAALGTPVVAIHGPTDPARNGPWSPDDAVVSRHAGCACQHRRRCTAAAWCLDEVTVDMVTDAAGHRLEVA